MELKASAEAMESAITTASLLPGKESRQENESIQSSSRSIAAEFISKKPLKTSPEAKSVASAFKATFSKFDSLIDEGYKFQIEFANIMPPPETPSAVSGMNPDAIKDPKLRQQYLDMIEAERQKRYKNTQQREMRSARDTLLSCVNGINQSWAKEAGVSPEELVELFTSSGRSRELLREKLGLVKPK